MGRQELEVRLGNEHISFETAKIGSLVDVQDSEDPEGLRVMYYLVQDLKVSKAGRIQIFWALQTDERSHLTPPHTEVPRPIPVEHQFPPETYWLS